MQLEEKLRVLLSPIAEHEGFDLVAVGMRGERNYRALEVLVDRLDGGVVTIQDCENLSRQLGATLEVEDVVPGRYHLEISSPGIERPLTKPAHYKRFEGKSVKIILHHPHQERRRFSGKITTSDETHVTIETPEGENFSFPYPDIQTARIVVSDSEFQDTLRKHKKEKEQASKK